MKTKQRRAIAPLKVTTVGTPLTGDFRALAALLVKLDALPAVRLVNGKEKSQCPPTPSSTSSDT